jgi:hypothetical protein
VHAPADQVQTALQAMQQAEMALGEARQAMDEAVAALVLSRGVMVEGERFGGYDQADPARHAVVEEARAAQRAYREAVLALAQAKAALTAARSSQQRHTREAWVKTHRPDLVLALQGTTADIASATDERSRFVAKHQHQQAQFAYQQAVAQAPVGEG